MMVSFRIACLCALVAGCSVVRGLADDTNDAAASITPSAASGVELSDAGRAAAEAAAAKNPTAPTPIPAPAPTAPILPPTTPLAPAILEPTAPVLPTTFAPDARRFLFASSLPEFSASAYAKAVPSLIAAFEEKTQRTLKPGAKHKVGLKIYTASGAGIATPKNLTRAVIAELEKRGFARADIFLVDLHEKRLRESGYLPKLRTENETFDGCPVLALDSGKYYNVRWFYENPLPSREIFARQGDYTAALALQDKQSLLPVPLFLQVDFWINLPVALDSPALGVSGALGNATIWNISNQRRFLDNPGNAQKAAVEIAAIPELHDTLVFHLLSLERYQYVGGPVFDANYCITEKGLWLSANPMILDFLMLQRMNAARAKKGFPLIEPEPIMFIQGNTSPILLGSCRPSELELVRVTP
ncbi:MAG: hypothetical protein LBV28_05450 [Puniceicoccales bacterium]|jgi:hypothetical protein|nr:hypothetical protein [Puniceicoccales bacterium]